MDSAITIFIQGHGKEDLNSKFSNDKSVELLSFVGKPGELGTMKLCNAYKNMPIDIVVLDFLHKQYSQYNLLSNEDQNVIFHSTGDELPGIYKNCGINYENGFAFTWPRLEREFIFEPAPHENCRVCNDPEEGNIPFLSNKCISGRCLPERKKNNICCPEYGLTIVASSFPEDSYFTLAGNSDRIKSNINMNLMSRDYWKSRTRDYKYLVDQIFNEKFIHLTDIHLLFKSMGFKNIYIYDPTCRDCEILDQLAEEYKTLERRPPYSVITEQPTNFISKSNVNNNGSSMLDDCVNGICKIFQKSKLEGGAKKYLKITKRNYKNNVKNKTIKKCNQKYALCPAAKCVQDPYNEKNAYCSCFTKKGVNYSIGNKSCKNLRGYKKNKQEYIYSTFSPTIQSMGYKRITCPSKGVNLNCMNKLCTVNPNNHKNAICVCTKTNNQGKKWTTFNKNKKKTSCNFLSGSKLNLTKKMTQFISKK